ncbi:MAG: integrase [Gammaproteobacteria bacterium]
MRAIIGARLLSSAAAQPGQKPFEIRDSRLPGFVVRIQPSGVRAFYAQLGRGRRIALGKVGHLTAESARHRCELVLGNVAHGREPTAGLDGVAPLTLGEFLETTYAPWVKVNRPRTAAISLARLTYCYRSWFQQPLAAISTSQLETWKTERLKTGLSPSTVQRDLAGLSAVLSHAVRLEKVASNAVRRVQKPRIDRTPNVRFLDPEEELALRTALIDRDQRLMTARDSANEWRRERHYTPLPRLDLYGDHLTPAVLVSLNTGLRRGELLSLHWSDISFRHALLSIHAASAKTGQTRHLPLNAEAIAVLQRWRDQSAAKNLADRIFPVTTSFKTAWSAVLKTAEIERFRWHDLRHHFASRLVQVGVNLNTVRELLGHGSLATTLRYAHLGPDQKRQAVELLTGPEESGVREDAARYQLPDGSPISEPMPSSSTVFNTSSSAACSVPNESFQTVELPYSSTTSSSQPSPPSP